MIEGVGDEGFLPVTTIGQEAGEEGEEVQLPGRNQGRSPGWGGAGPGKGHGWVAVS